MGITGLATWLRGGGHVARAGGRASSLLGMASGTGALSLPGYQPDAEGFLAHSCGATPSGKKKWGGVGGTVASAPWRGGTLQGTVQGTGKESCIGTWWGCGFRGTVCGTGCMVMAVKKATDWGLESRAVSRP